MLQIMKGTISGSDSGSDSDYDGDDNNGMRSRSKRHSKIEEGFQRRASLSHQNIMTRVYGANWMDNAKHSVNTSTNGNTRSNDGTLFGSTRNENADIDFKRKDIDSSSRLEFSRIGNAILSNTFKSVNRAPN